MDNNFNTIQLFKKNRELGGASLEQQTSDDLPNSEQQVPELIVRPLLKEKNNPAPTNSEQLTLPPVITKIVQTVLSMFDTNSKESLPLRILKDTDIRKWPIWSILRKPH